MIITIKRGLRSFALRLRSIRALQVAGVIKTVLILENQRLSARKSTCTQNQSKDIPPMGLLFPCNKTHYKESLRLVLIVPFISGPLHGPHFPPELAVKTRQDTQVPTASPSHPLGRGFLKIERLAMKEKQRTSRDPFDGSLTNVIA